MDLLGGFAWLLGGCGGSKNLVDDNLSSPDQIRSVIQQFQAATAKGDDGAACDLMNQSMRDNIVVEGVPAQDHCSIDAALIYRGERPSLPDAHIVDIRPDRHDQLADTYLDNGSRFRLRREGESADGEWRIYAINFHAFAVPTSEVADVSANTSPYRSSALTLSGPGEVVPAAGEHGARFDVANRLKRPCLLKGIRGLSSFAAAGPCLSVTETGADHTYRSANPRRF